MERTHTYVARLGAHQMLDTFAHLACRLVGKGQRKDRLRSYALREHIGDTCCENTRLARACTRNDERGAIVVDHSFALHIVKSFEYIFCHHFQIL